MITLQSPGEILFSFGVFNIHWYGFIIAIAFLAGLAVALYVVKNDTDNINSEHIINLSILLLIGGIVFSRLYYVLFSWDYFSTHPAEIFMVQNGGLSIHGAITGCFIIIIIYTRLHNLSLFKYTDIAACSLPLGQGIGRWGNFFNSEAFGLPTDLPLRVYIPFEHRPLEYIGYEYFHPTFLYESIWNFIIFFILFFIIRNRFKNISGVVTCSYLILYSFGRYFIEGLRIDNIYSVAGLHIAEYTSMIFIAAGIFGLLMLYLGKKFKLP